MRLRLTIILFLSSQFLWAMPVKTIIKGEFASGSEKYIRLYEYSNLISYKPVKVAQDSISKSGLFTFELMIEKGEVKTFFFAVERFKSFDIYIEAGKTYHLVFDSLDFAIQDEWYSPLTSSFPNLNFKIPDHPEDLNNQIPELILEFIRFSVEDFSEVMKMRNFKKLEEFKLRLDSMFQHIKHPFFQTILEYSFAETELTARARNSGYFASHYFNDRPFQYDNPAFMNLFNVFFDKYIYAVSRKIRVHTLDVCIVQQRDYKGLLDSLGKDSVLKNEVVRDMVLIKNLHQMYFSNILERESLFNLMSDISVKSKFKKHREIAASLLTEMDIHVSGQTAPPLVARKSNGETFSIDTIRGMFTYIFFFTTYCRVCYPEFVVLEQLYSKYKNSIHFVSVSMDVNFLKFYYFTQDYKYPWNIVNFYKNFDIEDQWNLNVYPHAYMLDPQEKIIHNNAPMPSEDLEGYFKMLLTPKKEGN